MPRRGAEVHADLRHIRPRLNSTQKNDLGKGGVMPQYPYNSGPDHGRMAAEASSSDGSRGDPWDISEAAGRPSLRVRTVERTGIVRFEDAEILFEESAVHAVG